MATVITLPGPPTSLNEGRSSCYISAVPIPDNLLFLPGGNPGTIVIGGGATTVAPAAIAPASGINPVQGVREYYTWADDLHFITGRHTFSAGAWPQRIRNNNVGAAQFSSGRHGRGRVPLDAVGRFQ